MMHAGAVVVRGWCGVVADNHDSLGAGCWDSKLYSTRGHKERQETIAYRIFGHGLGRREERETREHIRYTDLTTMGKD